ncbi:MAG: hypothetical protein LUD51_02445 [Clostridia bacterium]|nr:hypothetical protein [Clostridia bacterium]
MPKDPIETTLPVFEKYFSEFTDNYMIVGGTACLFNLKDSGFTFRRTFNLDMVIIIETITEDFVRRFKQFVKDGHYTPFRNKEKQPQYFRFVNLVHNGYPSIIELFTRKEDFLIVDDDDTFVPIKTDVDEEIASLSAILLDDDYHQFLRSGKVIINGVSYLDAPHLVAFKARAYLDLMRRKSEGMQVNTDDIKKHKNDIFRLTQMIASRHVEPNQAVKADIVAFLKYAMQNPPVMKDIVDVHLTFEEAVGILKNCYGIE